MSLGPSTSVCCPIKEEWLKDATEPYIDTTLHWLQNDFPNHISFEPKKDKTLEDSHLTLLRLPFYSHEGWEVLSSLTWLLIY